jgi:hypothetical protein
MAILSTKTKIQQHSSLEDKSQQLSKKVWDIDNKKTKIIDIPESGLDSKIVNSMNNGDAFVGIDHAGNSQSYTVINNRIYKSANLTEV